MTWYQSIRLLLSTLDAASASLVALYFIRLHERFGKYLAIAFAGVAIEAIITRLLFMIRSPQISIDLWFMIARLGVSTIKVAALTILFLYLLGVIGKKENNENS